MRESTKGWYIQSNDGRVRTTDSRAEARFYAWLHDNFNQYNVYEVRGNGYALGQFEI